jgi:hypothetical protein
MKKILIFIFIYSLVTVSCTERMDLDKDLGDGFPKIAVVEAFISTDTMEHVVKLSWSKRLDNAEAPPKITGADVKISGNGNEVILTEKEPGYYYTPADFYVEVGQGYFLTIDGIDLDEDGTSDLITAYDSVQNTAPFDSITVEYIESWEAWPVKAYAKEPGNEENFYMFRCYKNGNMVSDTLSELILTDDVLINGSYIYGLDTYYLQAEYQDEYVHVGDTITLEICGLSKQGYDFLIQAQIESGYSTPLFSGPPSNVEHNINGVNVFGAFITFSSQKASTIWEGVKQ